MSYVARVCNDRDLEAAGAELLGVFTHELVHSIQHSCSDMPGGLVEGIADALRMECGLSAEHWKEVCGEISFSWDAGYEYEPSSPPFKTRTLYSSCSQTGKLLTSCDGSPFTHKLPTSYLV